MIHRILTDLAWVLLLTAITLVVVLPLVYNFKHPELTQRQVLLAADDWYWWPFSGFALWAWVLVMIVRSTFPPRSVDPDSEDGQE